ncbi:signal peptidase I [Entomospira culicis]|uniref:Signal peptidase I n=1 Tax=Entomospira culicis TaxID=2719989 RepID=A0A968GEF7_9SPIO|nr:signal peptidase I [Entomospira culicis]NIZ18824.1 signal peptidase I [Entomospira culicis]NIZ69039.1 signal peptidase I [Entomospira culicis]WDI37627.1 signal peptidase I [Entomospira culicis]WDI39255.1 signal peptidase I [Entomospira culicis]
MSVDKEDKLGDFLLEKTEKMLTWRKRHKMLSRERSRRKGFFLDLLTSIPSTLLIVFLLNLYVIQAYVIPSESMNTTLLPDDRIFVDKFHYGPEIWLGVDKHLPAINPVVRGQIITFPNPDYESKGVIFETLRRFLFYISLTSVDIGRDAQGNPPIDLLIKRAVGYNGDRLIFRDGELFIKGEGESFELPEHFFQRVNNISYYTQRGYTQDNSELVAKLAEYSIYRDLRLTLPAHLERFEEFSQERTRYLGRITQGNPFPRSLASMMIYANRQEKLDDYYRHNRGIYVPHGYVLPLGDNRDNSLDGRYFGVIPQKIVQGRAFLRMWPWDRIGGIH